MVEIPTPLFQFCNLGSFKYFERPPPEYHDYDSGDSSLMTNRSWPQGHETPGPWTTGPLSYGLPTTTTEVLSVLLWSRRSQFWPKSPTKSFFENDDLTSSRWSQCEGPQSSVFLQVHLVRLYRLREVVEPSKGGRVEWPSRLYVGRPFRPYKRVRSRPKWLASISTKTSTLLNLPCLVGRSMSRRCMWEGVESWKGDCRCVHKGRFFHVDRK